MNPSIVAGPTGGQALRWWARMARDPLAMLVELHRVYGDAVRIPFGRNRPLLVLSRPEHAEHVLVARQRNYVKAVTYRPLRAFLGSGLLTSEGEGLGAAPPHRPAGLRPSSSLRVRTRNRCGCRTQDGHLARRRRRRCCRPDARPDPRRCRPSTVRHVAGRFGAAHWRSPSLGEGHSRLDRRLERQPQTLQLDQDRRRNPRTPRLICSTNSWRRTLGDSLITP